MTNLLGSVVLSNIENAASLADNVLVLSGYFSTRVDLDELRELFRSAADNGAVNTVVGGVQKFFDLTSDRRLTCYCLFDSDKIVDGWYGLRRFRYAPGEFGGHYPWSVELFFLGSDGFYQRGYDVEDLAEESNDWGL